MKNRKKEEMKLVVFPLIECSNCHMLLSAIEEVGKQVARSKDKQVWKIWRLLQHAMIDVIASNAKLVESEDSKIIPFQPLGEE